jgi:hypothetical protein
LCSWTSIRKKKKHPPPQVFVDGDAFRSGVTIMKPHLGIMQKSSERICNCRLLRARRVETLSDYEHRYLGHSDNHYL